MAVARAEYDKPLLRPRWMKPAAVLLVSGLALTGCSNSKDHIKQSKAASSSSGTSFQTCTPGARTAEGLYCVVEQFGTELFTDYRNASGPAGKLAVGEKVLAACLIPEATIPSAHGGWYRLPTSRLPRQAHVSRPYVYAVANTFENGDTVGQPINREVDPRVPVCPVAHPG